MTTQLPRFFPSLRLVATFILGAALGGMLAVVLQPRDPKPSAAGMASPPAPVPPAPPLLWADLASPDATVFSGNLRRIGCPEETIARILPPVAPESPATAAASAADGVPLASSSVPQLVSMPTPTPAPETVITAPVGDASLPVAFQPFPPKFKLTAEQAGFLDRMQQQFIEEIGGVNQDPASPTYRERWEKARARLDEQFRAVFGQEAFRRQDILLMREEAAARAAGEP